MPNFFLVDSNIAGTGGHYLEYAEQVLEVWHAQGYDCHLVANAAFRPVTDSKIYSRHSVMDFDMWGRNLAVDQDKTNIFSEDDRRYLRRFYSRGGLLWKASAELAATQHYASATTIPTRFARRLHRIHQLRAKVEGALSNMVDSATLSASSQAEMRKRRYDRLWRLIDGHNQLPATWPDGTAQLANMARKSAGADGYAKALGEVLGKVGLSEDDHVFIPTLSLAEARAVRDMLAAHPVLRVPRWSLLFRRDVFDGYGSTWRQQQWKAHEARNLFASFRRLPSSVRIAFLTDTDLLTRQYNELDSVPFSTTVVPVRAAPADVGRSSVAAEPLKVLVLRDNANDYGISYLATCLDGLTPDELKALTFFMPASGLEAHRPVDPLWVETSRARLRLYQGDILTVAGADTNIEEMLEAADIVLLIEWPDVRISNFQSFRDALMKRMVVASASSGIVREFQATDHDALITFGERDSAEGTAAEILSSLRTAASLCNPKGTDSWVVGYLGDARAEKGFHLLPDLLRDLAFARPGAQGIRLDSQIYHPNPGSDIRMLIAMEALRQEQPQRVRCIEGALASDEYLGLIAVSDIIFNVYDRNNYVSRSSGVFVEALAAAKPVITTAGTWMSALMGDWAKPYHDAMLENAQVVDISTLVEKSEWMFVGSTPSVTVSDKVMKLRPGYSICQIERRPAVATHLRVEISSLSEAPDNPLRVIVAWHDARGLTFEEEFLELNKTVDGVHSLVLEIPEGARAIWLGYSVRDDNRPVIVEQSQITWLVCDHMVARQPGGRAVSGEGAGTLSGRIAKSIIHICENYAVYQQSAEWIREHWAKQQVASELVSQLKGDALLPDPSRTRFVGLEW